MKQRRVVRFMCSAEACSYLQVSTVFTSLLPPPNLFLPNEEQYTIQAPSHCQTESQAQWADWKSSARVEDPLTWNPKHPKSLHEATLSTRKEYAQMKMAEYLRLRASPRSMPRPMTFCRQPRASSLRNRPSTSTSTSIWDCSPFKPFHSNHGCTA